MTPVTLFLATVVKFSVLVFFIRVLFFLLGSHAFFLFWKPFFLSVAAGSIVFGAFGALLQTKIKRFIGYTAINQMGYLFIGISSGDSFGLQSSFLYLFFYIVMGFSFFSVVMYVYEIDTGKDIIFLSQLRVFGWEHKNLSIFLALILFSMAGIPPLAGFFGKFFLLFSAFKAGNYSLVVLGLIMNAVSSFYYLRLIKCLFFVRARGVSKFSFFCGLSPYFVFLVNCTLTGLGLILVVSPFFLNKLLQNIDLLVFSAKYIQL